MSVRWKLSATPRLDIRLFFVSFYNIERGCVQDEPQRGVKTRAELHYAERAHALDCLHLLHLLSELLSTGLSFSAIPD